MSWADYWNDRLYICDRDDCQRGYVGSGPQADIDHPHGPATFRLAADGENVSVKCRNVVPCNGRADLTAPLVAGDLPPLCDLHEGAHP